MKIPLPQIYSYKNIAEVKDGILYVHNVFSNALMHDLTYATKDNSKCYYCGKPVSRDESNLDHMYPQSSGGPTIPNNLCISCFKCNNNKRDMNEEQYLQYRSIENIEDKRKFYRNICLNNDIYMKQYGTIIPKEWICEKHVEKIAVYFFMEKFIDSKAYKKNEKAYKKYGHIIRPIIVDRNFKLLDGFYVLLFAKNNSIEFVPTIVLENVELK